MSFILVDIQCRMPENVQAVLEKTGIPCIYQEQGMSLEECVPQDNNDLCIFIMNMNSSGTGTHIKFLKECEKFKRFALILLDVQGTGDPSVYEICKNDFQTNLARCEKDHTVVCGKTEVLEEYISTQVDVLNKMQSRIVLIASAKKFVGRNTLCKLLSEKCNNFNFEICDNKTEFIERSKFASKIIIIGKSEGDFLLPHPDDGGNRVILLYNKIDKAPLSFIKFDAIKRNVIDVMNEGGWGLSTEFKHIYPFSALYETIYHEYTNNSAYGLETLKSHERFYMWDQYGLPVSRDNSSNYSEEKIREFLENVCIADKIVKILNQKGM